MTTAERNECAEVVLLLPWLASGTLEDEERGRVAKHLEACPACRAEAARCRAERDRLRAEAAPSAAPHPAQLARLLARLDTAPEGEEDDAVASGPPPAARHRGLWSRTPSAARWLIAAQIAALAGLGVFAARPSRAPEPAFRTLSAAAAPAPGVLRVVFAPAASEAEIRALLLSVRAEIVAGPSAVGAYTLALDGGSAAEPVATVLGLLRADARIRLAEPVVGNHAAPR